MVQNPRPVAGVGGLLSPQNILDVMFPIHSALPKNQMEKLKKKIVIRLKFIQFPPFTFKVLN